MTAVTILSPMGWPPWSTANTNTTSTQQIALSTTKIAWIVQAAEAATITQLFYSCSAITSPPVLKISLQSLTAGLPSGTVLGGGSPASATFTPTATDTWVTLTNSYACARGDIFAIVIEYSSGTVGASNNATFRYTSTFFGSGATSAVPYAAINTGSWVASGPPFAYGWKSSSKSYGVPSGTLTNRTCSTTAEFGVKFALPAAMGDTFQVVGCRWKGASWPTGNTVWLTLYNGTTVLQQIGIPSDDCIVVNTANPLSWQIFFSTATLSSLVFGTSYYLGLCGSASRTAGMVSLDLPLAADMSAFTLDTNCIMVNRTLGTAATTIAGPVSGDTAWTETNTSRPFVWPILADMTEQGIIINSRATSHLRR